ncbi:hypothetical protein Mapa_008441 [Marchantia paleacea]|nr:hypothetical protein Mapa_008441 [Marchantia paleacea]
MQRVHLFVPLALELYGAMDTDFDMFVRECARGYHTRLHGVSLSLAYCSAYFSQHISIALQRALVDALHRRTITLGDAPSDALLFVDRLI